MILSADFLVALFIRVIFLIAVLIFESAIHLLYKFNVLYYVLFSMITLSLDCHGG